MDVSTPKIDVYYMCIKLYLKRTNSCVKDVYTCPVLIEQFHCNQNQDLHKLYHYTHYEIGEV